MSPTTQLPRWMSAGSTAGPSARDVRTAVIYVVVVLVLYLAGITSGPLLAELSGGDPLWPGRVSLGLMLIAAALTVFRTTRPGILLVAAAPLCLAEILGGSQLSGYVLFVEALWAPVARGDLRTARVTTGAGAVTASVLVAAFLVAGATGEAGIPLMTLLVFAVMIVVVTVFTPLAWAWEVRHHRTAREAAEAMARMEHELAGERAAREVEADRLSIAQDLHDVVAGHLTAVTLHTSLALELGDGDARARSLETARGSAEAALRDLRSVIGVLSTADAGPAEPTLSWEILRRRLGEDATVHIDPAVEDAPASARTALLHIGAEAVTNAVRHGVPPRSLTVSLDADAATMTCTNRRDPDADDAARTVYGIDAASTVVSPAAGTPAMGLRTMTNRAAAVSGVVEAGPSGETWSVTARIPLHPVDGGTADTQGGA